jgi:hypothetical protein
MLRVTALEEGPVITVMIESPIGGAAVVLSGSELLESRIPLHIRRFTVVILRKELSNQVAKTKLFAIVHSRREF